MRPVALTEVVAQALADLKTPIEAAGAKVEVPAILPTVMGNEEELYRVFLNLFGNALKYRRDDPPVITIGCQLEETGGWRLHIQDNGIGIELGQGYEERIFGLFQRLHQRDEYGGGTGIGLPICRKIINSHGGHIWGKSEGLGKGTTIFITLPNITVPL